MSQVVLELDDARTERLARRAAAAGYADVARYVGSLVDRELDEADIEQLLLSRLDGGPSIEVTPQFWADLRQQMATPDPSRAAT